MQSNPPDLEKRTAEFFAAITRRDWDDVIERIHPEARAIQNFVGQEMNARDLFQSMRALVDSLAAFAYENPRRIMGRDAVVEQHDVKMTRHDGVEVVLDVCIVLRFDAEGRIVRLDEYLDSAGVAPLQA
jgi:ketosteroid isomerase-like protein